MNIVDRYKYDREKINKERCSTLGSIFKIDLSYNRVSEYIEHAKSEDYRFGNVFAFKSEAATALSEVTNLYTFLNNYHGKVSYNDMIKNPVYVILNNGSIAEITKKYIIEENQKNNKIGIGDWTFEKYVKTWYDFNNCFNTLSRASITRDKMADIFENIKRTSGK